MKIKINNILLALILSLSSYACWGQNSNDGKVRQINWNEFKKHVPQDSISSIVKLTLLNVNKYALGSWFSEVKNYKTDSSGYLNLKEKADNNERRYRLPAGMAFALAVSIRTAAYDPEVTQVSVEEAENKAISLLKSVAFDHKVNNGPKKWGSDWQAAHWAYYCGYGSWLLWDKIEPGDRLNIERMITFEANRLLEEPALFYKDRTGKELIPGDSKIEEDAWNAELLYLAAVMMPDSENSLKWYKHSIWYMIAATSMPADLKSNKILHEKKTKDWLTGYNVEEPGVVINHGIIHPLYNALSSVVNAPIVFSLAGLPTPEAARFNISKIYNSLINTNFKSPPYERPGGSMYVKGQAQVYYPQGSDWGVEIYDSFANIDVAEWLYDDSAGQRSNARYWAGFHVRAVLNQQERFNDGHTYLNEKENSYYGKEAAIATRMGSAWMSIWMQAQRPVSYINN